MPGNQEETLAGGTLSSLKEENAETQVGAGWSPLQEVVSPSLVLLFIVSSISLTMSPQIF